MGAPELQSVPVKATVETRADGPQDGSAADGYTTSYAGVGVRSAMPGTGTGDPAWGWLGTPAARENWNSTQSHVTFLIRHVKEELAVPGPEGGKPKRVHVLQDSGSRVTSILEALVSKMTGARPGVSFVRPFPGSARCEPFSGRSKRLRKRTCPFFLCRRRLEGELLPATFLCAAGARGSPNCGTGNVKEVLNVDVTGCYIRLN